MNVRTLSSRVLLLSISLVVSGFVVSHTPAITHAQTDTSGIQAEIDQHNQQIADLEKEIAQYQSQLKTLGTQHQTLQSAIKTIDVSRTQTQTQIKVTQNKMDASALRLQQLSGQISQKEYEITLDRKSVAQSLRDLALAEDTTVIERMFGSDSLADAWTAADASLSVSDALRAKAAELMGVTQQLSTQKMDESSTRDKLAKLTTDLGSQKNQLDINKAEKDKLLSQTKSQESSYQGLVAQKRAEQTAFQNAIYQLSLKLKAADTSTAASAGKGVLSWPLTSVTITQMFGQTSDSGRLYASGTHNGMDFAAAIGTPVHAALSGTVYALNEGAVQNCQYGKWIMIKHANGLATLYAHLSQISVTSGQTVTTGQVIGYSGMTGYATGPHLHFGVYVSSSVSLVTYQCKSSPNAVSIPVAPVNGYLDPSAYL